MFWILILVGALAFTFAKLGAYFVMTKVLVGGLYVAILLIAALLVVLFWRKVSGNPPRRMNFLVEVCDPCQAFAYAVDGVGVSDFVTPAYFDPHPVAGAQYSFQGAVKAPFTVAAGGYVVWQDPSNSKFYAFTSNGTTGQTIELGDYPQGAGSTPREWVDSVLRKDAIQWQENVVDSLGIASTANALSTRQYAKHWTKELRLMKR